MTKRQVERHADRMVRLIRFWPDPSPKFPRDRLAVDADLAARPELTRQVRHRSHHLEHAFAWRPQIRVGLLAKGERLAPGDWHMRTFRIFDCLWHRYAYLLWR